MRCTPLPALARFALGEAEVRSPRRGARGGRQLFADAELELT